MDFANVEKTFAAIPGLSGTPNIVIFPSFFDEVTPTIFTFSIKCSPSFSSVTIVPVVSSNDDLKCMFIPYLAAISTDLG